jgi:hypothetical protein
LLFCKAYGKVTTSQSQKQKEKEPPQVKKIAKLEKTFEEAFDKIALATWNRPRTDEELHSFVQSRHEALADVELSL